MMTVTRNRIRLGRRATIGSSPGAGRERGSGGLVGSSFALVVAVVSGTLVIGLPLHGLSSVAAVVLSTTFCAVVALRERRARRLGAAPIAAGIALLFVVAIAVPPRASNDISSYTMYGRMVSVHGESPYQKVPADFPSDPFFKRVSPVWRHRGSVYGPAFVGYAAAGTAIAGDSVLGNRLFFQISAAAASAAALWLVWRRTRSSAALAWLGLHPLLGPIMVNGGHNDIYIGAAIVAAAMLAARGRARAAGLVLGLAALIKLTALLALGGLVFWAWRRRDRRLALTATAVAAVTVVVGYLPFLGGASRVLGDADKTVTRASVWNPLASALVDHDAGRLSANPLAPNDTLIAIFYAGAVVVGILALVLAWRSARALRPELPMGVTTASYTVGAEYTYPWYAGWALPVVAEHEPPAVAWIVWAQAALMIAALKVRVHPSRDVIETVVQGVLTYAAPVVLFVAFVVTGYRHRYTSRPDRSSPPTR